MELVSLGKVIVAIHTGLYRCFDAHNISPENREAVEMLLSERRDSFSAKTAKRASQAAAPLAAWVTANVKFSYVLEKIRPLEREQANLHRSDKYLNASCVKFWIDKNYQVTNIILNCNVDKASNFEISKKLWPVLFIFVLVFLALNKIHYNVC